MTARYAEVLGPLREAYDGRAACRDGRAKQAWKLAERQAFCDRLAPGARLLEVGAGTGQDSAYFREHGLAVVATDLSPAMVEHCRAKGLDAHVMDGLHLGFPPDSFDTPTSSCSASPRRGSTCWTSIPSTPAAATVSSR